jgi:aerobic-type carbon monoxide dehydrogenase small subunit (CoxS/CutS family)
MSIKYMCTGTVPVVLVLLFVNGKPALTCMMLACECDHAIIETSEGYTKSGHPLIEAYIKHDCMQCGFCTPVL